MIRPARIALPLLWSLALAAQAATAEWTRFRGPDGAGISPATGLPAKWTEKDYNWKVTLPGYGHSSPVVWGDRVFVTCGAHETAQRIILCLKAPDGSVAWERRYESEKHVVNPANSFATSTPAVDAERVYLYWTTPKEVVLLALDHAGKEVWRRGLGEFISQHGSGTSPIVFDALVVLCNDQEGNSNLLALDAATGETRWEVPRNTVNASYSTPCVYRPDDGPPELVFNSQGHGITSIDPKTGKANWEFKEAFPLRTVGSPAVAAGLIVGTCGVGGSGKRLVAVRPGSKAKGLAPSLAYELKKSVPYTPTPLEKDGLLFLCSEIGVATCLRAATGEQVWQERLGDNFYGSFVWADGRLYIMSRKGTAYVLEAAEKYELLASNPLGEGSHATPAIADGVLYLRTFSHLIAIRGKK